MRPPNQQAANLHQQAILAFQQRDADSAVRLLRAAVAADPGWAAGYNDLGNVLAQCGRMDEAAQAYRQAIGADPKYAQAINNLGNLHQMEGSLEPAVASYRAALALRPDYAEAHRNLGSALRRLGRLDEAVVALSTALELNPGFAEAGAQLVLQLKQLCDWRLVDGLTARLREAVQNGAALNPFIFLTLETSPREQHQCARSWAEAHSLAVAAAPPSRSERDRLTVGYLSADFQDHATVHLIGEVFAQHDRSRFRVHAYSYGVDDGSEARGRMRNSFDSFVDLEHASHAEAAARIRADGVDILVDLKGYTTDARPEIIALRPAPVQVSYLGFPGTMGNAALDYVLVDSFVVPPQQQENFTEKLVYLPRCYFASGRGRVIAETPSRSDCGLPERGFVFCCFNTSYKLTAAMFDIWLRLLRKVPGSVLWLMGPPGKGAENLRREADSRLPGAAKRLVFAPALPNAQHLARFAVADLFLDTLPYNAHTLAADALWGGCPVVTCPGETFPSRVAGSLLHSMELPELVTGSLAGYEAQALRLAREPALLQDLRRRVADGRLHSPLFDTRDLTRHLEAAYEKMWAGQA